MVLPILLFLPSPGMEVDHHVALKVDHLVFMLRIAQRACDAFGDRVRVRHMRDAAYLVPFRARFGQGSMPADVLTMVLAERGFVTQTVSMTSEGVLVGEDGEDADGNGKASDAGLGGCISPSCKKARHVLEATEVSHVARETIDHAVTKFQQIIS